MVVFLSIAEIDGNTSVISVPTGSRFATQNSALQEKVFCVLTEGNTLRTQPVHTQTFNPRHISTLTLNLRSYNPVTNTYEDYPTTSPKVGLCFKIVTADC
jgi:hypothetical protein